jgi:hypothetical protein
MKTILQIHHGLQNQIQNPNQPINCINTAGKINKSEVMSMIL